MKLTPFLFFFIPMALFSQKDKYWYAFHQEISENTAIGFKNNQGTIMLKPRFSPFTINQKFEKIIAINDANDSHYTSYYVNKKGKKFGLDSLYVFDFTYDVELEGHIRFSTGKYLDSIGLFNAEGKITIEPIYNKLSRVNNGLVIAKKGAKQVHEKHGGDCDHWSFEGGKEMLLDTLGKVLIDNFRDNDLHLNLYSLEITEQENRAKFRHNFTGVDQKYYSFISYKEEFEDFIYTNLKNIRKDTINDYLFLNLQQNKSKSKKKKQDHELWKALVLLNENQISILSFTLFHIDYSNSELITSIEKYLDNAYQLIVEKYPVFEIQIMTNTETKINISFIRTENGYKIYDYSIYKYNSKRDQAEPPAAIEIQSKE
ncbi:WG repeat-containing protein [Flavobacterium sp. J27]|uniref:WG repeat-containing protein n=1 Tax=Flavobacterium sp. J27 TaxID=2060419 RepID=UPI00102FFB75|nr:WG repeat-containing protein [Flavobacterium sp. J27]